jgi:hypothetical protein
MRNEVAAHPLVRAVLDTFPGATIAAVRDRNSAAGPVATAGDDAPLGDESGIDPVDEASPEEDGP